MGRKQIDSQVNEMIGTALGVGFITPEQMVYCLGMFLFFLPLIFVFGPLNMLLLFSCIYGLWWIVTGNDPTKFFEKMLKPKEYIAVEPVLDFNRAEIPIPKKDAKTTITIETKGKKKTYHYIEKEFKFLTYGQIELSGKEIGFYLLQRGPQVMFIFAWSLSGHDPSMEQVSAENILDTCREGLNNLPKDIDLKFYEDLTKSCEDYKRMQAGLMVAKQLDPLSKQTIRSRAERAEELTAEGRLLKHSITVFAKYRVFLGGDYAVNLNWLEELLSKTQPLVGAVTGQDFDSRAAWSKVIGFAYKYAYQKVNFLLSDNKAGFGLKAKTLSVQSLFARDYLELHELTEQNPVVPRTPQYIIYNEFGLDKPVIHQWGTHAIGTVFEPQICPAVPKFDKHLVYYPVKEKYAGFIRLGQIRQYPKDKESVERGYLKYLWNILAGSNKAVYDCRVVAEITADRSGFEIVNLDKIVSHSIKREALAAKHQTVDVIASRRREQAIDARDELAQGNIPYWVSFGIWLYRDSKEELEKDLEDLCGRLTGVTVEREENCVEHVWFQTWPFEWSAFLTQPHHRRQKYISYQAIPSIPLVKTKSIDKQGVMFVNRELSSPVYIDFANEKNHTAIIAKTGTGKSNVILEILQEYIIHEYIVVLFDFPRPDGTSTYTVLIPLLQKLGVKAAYHNVRDNVMNIIELPDLSHLKDPVERSARLAKVMENHIQLLATIVMGTVQNPDREVLVKSLLTDCYADFHEQPTIKRRYVSAIAGGYGSQEYQQMPILSDFVAYAGKWFADYIKRKKEQISILVNDTIDVILTQLRGILRTPLGRSLDGISSFDTKVDVLVIGLTNVSDSLDCLIYAMGGLNALYRAAFSAKRSLLGVDEGTILYKFAAFARETGTIPVHGRKWGCNFLVAAQEITTILNSCSGGEIFKNLDNIFGGHISDSAIPEMTSKDVGFRSEIIKGYTSESFKPSAELRQSYWYLKRGDLHLELTHPVSDLLLGLGATEPTEDKARKRVLSRYKGDEIEGVKEFARLLAVAKKQDKPMSSIYPGVILEKNQKV